MVNFETTVIFLLFILNTKTAFDSTVTIFPEFHLVFSLILAFYFIVFCAFNTNFFFFFYLVSLVAVFQKNIQCSVYNNIGNLVHCFLVTHKKLVVEPQLLCIETFAFVKVVTFRHWYLECNINLQTKRLSSQLRTNFVLYLCYCFFITSDLYQGLDNWNLCYVLYIIK